MNIKENGLKTLQLGYAGLGALIDNFPEHFEQIITNITKLTGKLILSGMGKSGYISQKIAASFASTGTCAVYLHPSEASHGDLGIITRGDVVVLLSNSGQTKELANIINYCINFDVPIVGITMNRDSMLAKASNYLILLPAIDEASSLGAPTTSALMALAIGDAMVVATHQLKGFTKHNYKLLHPAGSIGASLTPVSELMHTGDKIPLAHSQTLMPEVIITITNKSFGCCAIVDDEKLVGIITDGDLRRNIKKNMLKLKAKDVMSSMPKVLTADVLAGQALKIMNQQGITNCLVAEPNQKLVGIIHVHDLLRNGVV